MGDVDVFCLAPDDGAELAPPQPEVREVVTTPWVRQDTRQWIPGWVRGDAPRKVEAMDWDQARRDLQAWDPQIDLVWYSHLETWMSLSDSLEGVPAIVDFDNLENHLMHLRRFTPPHLPVHVRSEGVAAVAGNLGRWATSRAFDLVDERRLARHYQRCAHSVEHVVVCSELDARRGGFDNVEVVPNGGSSPASIVGDRRTPRGERPTLSFVGALDYEPNTDAVEWFVTEILPIIRARMPEAQFRVIGRGQECVSVNPRTPGLTFTGPVPDVQAELDLVDVSVVPIRLGAGTRLKVIESMASHIPQVTTTVGCEGIDLMHGDEALIVDDPHRFADACLQLLTDGALRQRLADNAADLFERRYRWEAIEQRVGRIARDVVDAQP